MANSTNSSPSSEYWADEFPTPFNNPLLMETILASAKWSQSDLANFRLVCKLWYNLTLSKWRETAVLTLTPPVSSSNPGIIDSGKLCIRAFLRMVENHHDRGHDHEISQMEFLRLADVPFKKFRLLQFQIKLKIPKPEQNTRHNHWQTAMDKTLCRFLPHARSIHFDSCTFRRLSSITIFFHEKTRNLEEIKFTHCRSDETSHAMMKEKVIDRYVGETAGIQLENIKSFEMIGDNFFPFPMIDPHYFTRKLALDRFKYWPTCNYPSRRIRSPGTCKLFVKLPGDPFEDRAMQAMFAIARQTKIREFPIMGFGFRYGLKWENLSITKLDLLHYNGFTVSYTRPDDVISLHKLKLRLTSFAFQMNNHSKVEGVHFLLSPYAETLTSVTIFRDLDLNPFEDFPLQQEFPKIEDIHLLGNVTSTLRFLQWTPNIESLNINFKCFEHLDQLILKENEIRVTNAFINMVDSTDVQLGRQQLQLAKLRNFCVDYKFPPKSLKRLKQWMPNLIKFGSILENETFRVVCEEWPNLRELTLTFGSDVDDEGITGLNYGTYGSINKISHRNINSLSCLQKFDYHALCGQADLTDFSVYYGFLDSVQPMINLHTIFICVSSDFSLTAENDLKKNFMQANVIRNYGDELHSGIGCCRYMKLIQTS